MENREEQFTRFKAAPWAGNKYDIIIGGAGGIGSWLSIALQRTGDHKIVLIDPDIIETSNLGGQAYVVGSEGRLKMEVCSEITKAFSGKTPLGLSTKLENRHLNEDEASGPPKRGIMISTFDNMEARKIFFALWKKGIRELEESKEDEQEKSPILFIDGRMRAEQFEVYFVTKDRIEDYEKTLYNDDEIPDEMCTYKATTHIGMMCAAKIVQGFTNHVANTIAGEEDLYTVPFKYSEHCPIFNFEIL